jgi:hypothetical protein
MSVIRVPFGFEIDKDSDYMVVVTVTLRNWRTEQDLVQRYAHLPVPPDAAGNELPPIRRASEWVVRTFRNDLEQMIHMTYADLVWTQPELPFGSDD